MAADMNLPPGGRGPGDDDEASEALKQSRPRVVGQLGLGLLELDARPGAGDAAQTRRAQRRVEQMRDNDDETQHDDQQAARRQCCGPDSTPVGHGHPCPNLPASSSG